MVELKIGQGKYSARISLSPENGAALELREKPEDGLSWEEAPAQVRALFLTKKDVYKTIDFLMGIMELNRWDDRIDRGYWSYVSQMVSEMEDKLTSDYGVNQAIKEPW